MGLKRKKLAGPTFSKFPDRHFKEGARRITWAGEPILTEGFYLEVRDLSDRLNLLRGLPGANSYTYVALTSWRAIVGYLANGNFTSYPYSTSDVIINRVNDKGFVRLYNQEFLRNGIPDFSPSFEMPDANLELLEEIKSSNAPGESESSVIREIMIGWGEGPLAELQRLKSKRDYQLVEVCSKCHSHRIVDEDIKPKSVKLRSRCHSCLRIRSS